MDTLIALVPLITVLTALCGIIVAIKKATWLQSLLSRRLSSGRLVALFLALLVFGVYLMSTTDQAVPPLRMAPPLGPIWAIG